MRIRDLVLPTEFTEAEVFAILLYDTDVLLVSPDVANRWDGFSSYERRYAVAKEKPPVTVHGGDLAIPDDFLNRERVLYTASCRSSVRMRVAISLHGTQVIALDDV